MAVAVYSTRTIILLVYPHLACAGDVIAQLKNSDTIAGPKSLSILYLMPSQRLHFRCNHQ